MRLFCYILVLLIIPIVHYGQSRFEHEELYRDANSYFYFEDYEEALALYLKVYPNFPDNRNLDFRIGFCYLSIPGSKSKAIPYLERAVTNITHRYNEESIKEQRAPIDAIFYLGNAYFINNQLDKAQSAYNEFSNLAKRQRQFDMDYFHNQMESLERSRVLQAYPVNFMRSNLGNTINDRFSNYNAVVSGDGTTLAYTTKRRFYEAIFISKKEGDSWGAPRNITIDLMVEGNCQTLCLSYSGDELYLFKEHEHVGNIYVSFHKEGRWTPMQPLNSNVNTMYYETHASISSDGKKLFFTSNRAGGYGGLDIYVSERTAGGDWGPAKNLGSTINTRFNENSPFITSDGQTLFFSSEGHNTLGGYDIFFSQLQNNKWAKPINLGYPINTTDDDLFYHPLGDGSIGFISIFDREGYGEMDICQIEIFLPKYQRSIITSNDLYTRTTDLPPKTLVVDTLNYPGVALLDPVKPLHQKYLDPNRNYKLFFNGKEYSIRDQHKLATPIDLTLDRDKTKEGLTRLPQRDVTLSYSIIEEFIDSIISVKQTLDSIPSVINDNIFDSILYKPFTPWIYSLHDTASYQNLISVDALTSIMVNLADKKTKLHIESMFRRDWQVPPSLLMLQASRLVRHADSLGISYQLAHIFAQLLDHVSGQPQDVAPQHPRQISSLSTDEEFFFWFQRLKRDASPELSELLDYCILNEPSINSFESLWIHLSTRHTDEVEQHLEELVNIMAQHGFRNFFSLPNDKQLAVSKSIEQQNKKNSARWFSIIGIVLGLTSISLVVYNYTKDKKG